MRIGLFIGAAFLFHAAGCQSPDGDFYDFVVDDGLVGTFEGTMSDPGTAVPARAKTFFSAARAATPAQSAAVKIELSAGPTREVTDPETKAITLAETLKIQLTLKEPLAVYAGALCGLRYAKADVYNLTAVIQPEDPTQVTGDPHELDIEGNKVFIVFSAEFKDGKLAVKATFDIDNRACTDPKPTAALARVPTQSPKAPRPMIAGPPR